MPPSSSTSRPPARGPARALARALLLGVGLALAPALAPAVHAQLPYPRLTSLFPCAAPAGSTVTVSVTGTDLDEPAGLLASHPGLRATPAENGTFRLEIATNTPAGPVDLRWWGRFGASAPRVFLVTDQPVATPAPTNTSPAAAFPLAPGASAQGRLAAGQRHWFEIPGKAGQPLRIRVQSAELDSRLDPEVFALGPDGRELQRTRGHGRLECVPPTDGPCRVAVHDRLFRGGDDYHYRLSVDPGPWLDFAVPAAVRPGTNRLRVFGRGLPGSQPSPFSSPDGLPLGQVEVDVLAPENPPGISPGLARRPSMAALDLLPWRWTGAPAASTPLLLAWTTLPVTAAPSPGVASFTPPGVFSAPFPRRGEWSGVSFKARKGDVWWLELAGERLGFPVDPHALVQRQNQPPAGDSPAGWTDVTELAELSANPGDREFNLASRDAAGRLEIPEDGVYRVVVRDLFHLGATSPRGSYALTIRPASPGFQLVALPQPPARVNNDDRQVPPATVALRRGGTWPIRVVARREDGFDGEIRLTASRLPEGVRASPGRIAPGQSAGVILLTAATNAPAGAAAVEVTGEATLGNQTLRRPARAGSVIHPLADFNNEPVASRPAASLVVAVVRDEPAPVVVEVPNTPLEAPANGRLAFPLAIRRHGEFPAAFSLKPLGLPEVEKAKETAVPEKADRTTVEWNLAELKLPPGTHRLWFQGQLAGKYRNQPEALAAAEAELKTATEAVASAPAAEKPAREKQRQAAQARRQAAEERAKPRDATVAVFSAPFEVRILAPTNATPAR